MQTPENPWTTLSRRDTYQNRWIHVEEHEVLNPAGKPGIYGVVRFQHLAIGIVPVDEEGNTWLVGQHRYPLDTYTWEIPEGGGPLDIPPLDSAKRELLEECGLVASQWEEILRLQTSNSCTDERAIIYLATGLTEKSPQPEEEEELQIRKLPLTEAIEMAMNGGIEDAMSVAALLKVKHIFGH